MRIFLYLVIGSLSKSEQLDAIVRPFWMGFFPTLDIVESMRPVL